MKGPWLPEPRDCVGRDHVTIEVGVAVPQCRFCGGRQSLKTGKVMKAKVDPSDLLEREAA